MLLGGQYLNQQDSIFGARCVCKVISLPWEPLSALGSLLCRLKDKGRIFREAFLAKLGLLLCGTLAYFEIVKFAHLKGLEAWRKEMVGQDEGVKR